MNLALYLAGSFDRPSRCKWHDDAETTSRLRNEVHILRVGASLVGESMTGREISDEDLEHFVSQGFLIVKGAVDDKAVDTCLRTINNALGRPGLLSSGGAQKGLGKLDGSITSSPEVRDLLFGREGTQWLFDTFAAQNKDLMHWWIRSSPQIALRFPEKPESLWRLLATTEIMERGEAWHTDGLRKGKSHPFSLLVGVCLSDCSEEFQGNLLLFPGKHLVVHDMMRFSETQSFLKELPIEQENEKQNSTHVAEEINNLPALPPLGKPLHLELRKGDIVLLHPDLPHSGGSNWGSQIRIMVYFRICLTDNMDGQGHREDPFYDFSDRVRQAAARR